MLYTIERNFTGYSDAQVDAAAFRALLCINFFTGMRWVRSFYDPESQQGRCFYEANVAGDLVHHGTAMAIPVGEVRPAIEIRRDGDGIATGEPTDTADSRTDGSSVWVVRYRAEGHGLSELADKFRPEDVLASSWLRAFADRDMDEVFAIFQSHDRLQVETDAGRVQLGVKDVTAVREVLPSDIREMPPLGAK